MKIDIDEILEYTKNKGFNKLETARYIYIKLGEIFTYDVNTVYLMSDKYEEESYNNEIYLKDINNKELDKKMEITCKQTADILKECLEKAKIDSENIGFVPSELKHVTTILKIDNKKYALSLSKDLANIQKGFKTQFFAAESEVKEAEGEKFDVISEKEMKKIDKRIGYCKNDLYMNDVIEMLKREITDDETFKEYLYSKSEEFKGKEIKKDFLLKYKLDFIFGHIKNNMDPDKRMDLYETYKYFKTIIKELLTPEERGVRILGNNHHSEDKFVFGYNSKDFSEKYLIYQIKSGNKYIYYQYDNEELGFKEINLSEISEEMKNGMQLYPYQRIEGIEEYRKAEER